MRKYHYLVLFLAGFLVIWPFMLHKLYGEQEKNTEVFEELSGEEEEPADQKEAPGAAVETLSGNNTVSGNDTVSGNEAEAEGPEDAPEQPKEAEPEEFFRNTLFIGDSRTMGLAEYADLDDAVVFANTGMNIYRLYTLKNAVRDQEPYLEDILAGNRFRKIYLMLGINELGYDEGQTVKRFEEEVLKLQKLQPEAKIVLEANLHVTAARSERDEIFNNDGIDRINGSIRQIAEKYGFGYIDVNEIFDDDTGGLNPECTHDEVHVLGKYYQEWADWIRETGI